MGEQQGLLGALDELSADVHAVSGYYPRPSRKDRIAVTMGQVGRCSRGCQAAHLFGTERDPYPVLQILAASGMGAGLAVITTAQADKTGADQVNGGEWFGHVHWVGMEMLMKKTYKTSLSPLQQKRLLRISLLLVVLLLLAIFFIPGKGLYFLRKEKRRIAEINAEKQALIEKNNALREEIKRLKTDERYLEEVARGQHGLLKKDEQVFDFSPKEQKKGQK